MSGKKIKAIAANSMAAEEINKREEAGREGDRCICGQKERERIVQHN